MPFNGKLFSFSAKHFFSTKLASADKSRLKGLTLKKVNFENKVLFGNLLETSKDRRKRLSSKKENILTSDPSVAIKSGATENNAESGTKIRCASAQIAEDKDMKQAPIQKKKKRISEDIITPPFNLIESKTEYHPPVCILEKIIPYELSNVSKESNCGPLMKSSKPDDEKIFPLVNEEKTELQIKIDQEIISGKTITKSESFYSYPSVTRILNLTMSDASKSALLRWRNGLIAEMGEEKFQEFYKKQLSLGSLFHANLQDFLIQLIPRNSSILNQNLEGCWKSLETIFTKLSDVKLLESHVVHEKLKYRGVIDCIALYRDMPLVIEWKKSSKQKFNLRMTYDAPLQLSAYIGALNYDSSYPFKVTKGLVVVAYDDGTPASSFLLSADECKLYWKEWLLRYQKYNEMVQIINGTERKVHSDEKLEF